MVVTLWHIYMVVARVRSLLGPAIGVPRRFGISSLLVVTAACAALFSFLSCLDLPPIEVAISGAIIGGFFALIAIGQAVLFGGQKPRQASIVIGGAVFTLFALGEIILFLVFAPRSPPAAAVPWLIFALIAQALILGPVFGYLAGGVIAGIFLVLDRIEHRRNSPARHQPASPPIVAESDEESADRASPG